MNEQEAIKRASEYCRSHALRVGSVVGVRYLDRESFDENERGRPADLLETSRSVRATFRNHWVVEFDDPDEGPGVVTCDGQTLICVYDTGDVAEFGWGSHDGDRGRHATRGARD